MSQFNHRLDQARRRQKRIYLISAIAVVITLFLVAALLVVFRGTRIEIIPENARESATIRVVEGLALCFGDRVYSLVGNPVIAAVAPGFKEASRTIGPAHLGKVLTIELFELPGRLVAVLSGSGDNLARTTWQLDGRNIFLGERLDHELEAGSYRLTVDNPYYQLQELIVDSKRGELTEIQVELQPVSGMLDISSIPVGAGVVIDGVNVGTTPLGLPRQGGSYGLRISAENFRDSEDELSITRAAPEVSRNYHLVPKQARINLTLSPQGGVLLVNGVEVAEPLFLDVAVKHRLSYMKAGYYTENQSLLLTTDETRRVSFSLKKELGKVEISSSSEATVVVDGKEYGTTPLSVTLPAVPHTITLQKNGYRPVSRVVTPEGGELQKISVSLIREGQARLQEAPRKYTNQAGIKMKLFMVKDSFTMGAPRSEKGQRANEFQKKIVLTKPFYASLYEITNDQFARFRPQAATGAAGNPVTSVTWQDAAAFCNWLSAKENLHPFYRIAGGRVTGFEARADGYRLLSEGEWEWLARKAAKKKQTIFPWGDETVIPPKAANVADESAKGTVRFYVPGYNDGYSGVAPVGSLNKESSGLYDMAGNVSEWVHDFYSIQPPAANSRENNPLGEQRGGSHLIKGANFRSGTITTLRPAYREGLTGGRDDVGFRVARYLYGGEDG